MDHYVPLVPRSKDKLSRDPWVLCSGLNRSLWEHGPQRTIQSKANHVEGSSCKPPLGFERDGWDGDFLPSLETDFAVLGGSSGFPCLRFGHPGVHVELIVQRLPPDPGTYP